MMRSFRTSHISSGKNLLFLALASLFAASTFLACGDGITQDEQPVFNATPDPIDFSVVNIGDTSIQTVMIENTGSGDLHLRNIELNNHVGDALSLGDDWPDEVIIGSDDSEIFSVEYTPTEELDYSGTINMSANTSSGSESIDIQTADFGAEIFVDPSHVDFPQTPAGSEEWRVARIYNIGGGTLTVDDIFVSSGGDDFDIAFFEVDGSSDGFPDRANDSASPPTNTLEPDGDPIHMRVVFSPEDEQPKHGEVLIQTNDGDHTVNLSGNSGDACLEVSDGDGIEFGPAAIDNTTYMTVTLRNCSPEADLELSGISISDDDGGVFSLQPGSEPGSLPDSPHVLSPGDVTTTVVGYSPTDEVENVGELLIESDDSMNPERYIPITGNGVDAQCPIAEASGSVGVAGGGQNPVFATNQDDIYLHGSDSHDPDGTSLDYEWSIITMPDGSMADVVSPFDADTQFEVDIVGHFQVELVVYDETGLRNCEPAIVEVDATPDEDIHIQLVWSAPEVDATYGGPNEATGVGTDLDIHYVNTQGIDEWGASDSIYWQRTHQDWGNYGVARLDIDDLLGVNPENINHSDPGMGGRYRVGVHYFNDNGWGAADATVRIYFGTGLYDQWDRRLEQTDNFWYVGNIFWDANPTVEVQDDLQGTHSLPSASGF